MINLITEQTGFNFVIRKTPSTIGQRLLRALESAGKTQADAAKAAGVTASAVSKWVAGQTEPRRRHLLAIIQKLGLNIDEFAEPRQIPYDSELLQKLTAAWLREQRSRNISLEEEKSGKLLSVAYQLCMAEPDPYRSVNRIVRQVLDFAD